MSSPPPFEVSSPTSQSISRPRKSQFTYKHLTQLSQYNTACPLRVIAHIDLDAFYAQCEMVRLGVPADQPLAVQQWQGLIAINYPARAFGLSRHVTCSEAKKACPSIILQHVATWKEGDDKWAYHDDAFAQIATHKVSLDPYRLESRRILALIKEVLPAKTQRVEKASIDEVFLDLSAHVHSLLLERYPVLSGPAPYDDPASSLPRPPTTAIDWTTDALVDLDDSETEDHDPDWDDIALSLASEIVRSVRAAVYDRLHYTCSAGVARNKTLAKLGSGHRKPNAQTIVRNRAITSFLSDFKFTKIRNLGGKLGDEVVAAFNTDSVTALLEVPEGQLKKTLGDDTGGWLYQILRGIDQSEVNPRTQIKSMLSAKSFRPSINDMPTAVRWLRIFVADIHSRLCDEPGRRPRTINLHHRQGAQTRSKQAPIPGGKFDEQALFELARNLLGQVVVEGRAWPCANLSLSVGGFEDGPKDNLGIGAFLVRAEEARMVEGSETPEPVETPPPAMGVLGKRRRDEGIRTFFGSTSRTNSLDEDEGPPSAQEFGVQVHLGPGEEEERYTCPRCSRAMGTTEKAEHDDWHFARDLQREESAAPPPPPPARTNMTTKPASGKGRGKGKPPEKGQRKIAFG